MPVYCKLTGEICQNPVVTKNGDVYEKRVIEKHIESVGTDPETKQPLTKEDLIPLKVTQNSAAVKPKTTAQQSIPGLLTTLQNEWDALMLETFNLKQQLQSTKQELSHALYQHDAACRVIARLLKEKEQYKQEVANLRAQFASRPATAGGDQMEVDQALPGLSADLKSKIGAKAKELSSTRGSRQVSSTLVKREVIQTFKAIASHPPHKASTPGILCLDVHPNPEKEHIIITGGMDKTAVLLNKNSGKKEAVLSGHQKPVISVKFHPTDDNFVFTASQDNTVKVWNNDVNAGKWNSTHTLKIHSAAITGMDLHATAEFVVTSSLDRSWALHDVRKGVSLLKVTDPSVDLPFTTVHFHPDGLILGTGGEDTTIRIWDIRSQKSMATFEGHKGRITDLAFSENGYYLASAGEDKVIKLWDLRNPRNIASVTLDDVPHALSYDYSGKYLAAAVGQEIRIYTKTSGVKGESETNHFDFVQTFDDHTKKVTGVKWGSDAKFIASTSMDRNLKIYTAI